MHVVYCNTLFQLFDYYCLLFCRYWHICWQQASQQNEEMEEEVVEYPIGHIPIMPHMLDRRACIELAYHICALFTRE